MTVHFRDVLENFIERWEVQGVGMPPLINDQFCRAINPEAVASVDDPSKEWNVQLFRCGAVYGCLV